LASILLKEMRYLVYIRYLCLCLLFSYCKTNIKKTFYTVYFHRVTLMHNKKDLINFSLLVKNWLTATITLPMRSKKSWTILRQRRRPCTNCGNNVK
jgi:hypothetical protein